MLALPKVGGGGGVGVGMGFLHVMLHDVSTSKGRWKWIAVCNVARY